MKRRIYLDYASCGEISFEVKATIKKLLDRWDRCCPSNGLKTYTKSLQNFAKLIGTREENVAGVPNTFLAAGLIASAMPLGSGSNIVLSGLESPLSTYSWLVASRRGASVRITESSNGHVSMSEFERLINNDTDLVVVSHVIFSTGYRYNLEDLVEVTHRHKAFLFIDAYQSAGVIEIDAEKSNVDFLCTGSDKWISGLPGVGYLYVKRRIVDKLHPLISNRKTSDLGFDNRMGTVKFETGYPNIMGYAAVSASIDRILRYGLRNVEKRILSLTQWLIDELDKLNIEIITPRKRERRAGIVVFKTKSDPSRVIHYLEEKGIIVWKRFDKGIRISIHYECKEEDIQYLIDVLIEMNKQGLL